jgi:hypothetical protein
MVEAPTLVDLHQEEERLRIEEDAEVERKRQAAARLAFERGLQTEGQLPIGSPTSQTKVADTPEADAPQPENASEPSENSFVPARLPHFG